MRKRKKNVKCQPENLKKNAYKRENMTVKSLMA